MIKTFKYEYGSWDAYCELTIDTEKFKKEDAEILLGFFIWDYDENADPVDEYMKKIAMQCIKVATFKGINKDGVIDEFKEMEGWPHLDGTNGITLVSVTAYEFDESSLELEEEP